MGALPAADDGDAERLMAVLVDCIEATRRYRALRAWADAELWPQALAVGDALRRRLRCGEGIAGGVDRLRALRAAAEAAITREHAGPAYQALAAAWSAGDHGAVAARVPEVFAGLAPAPPGTAAYVGIPVRRRGRTLVPPAEVARSVLTRLAEGVGVEDGAPALTPLVLDADPAWVSSPVMLEHPLDGKPWRGFLDEERGDILVFTRWIPGPWAVLCAADASDARWEADPEEYAAYRDALRSALASRGVTVRLHRDECDG